MTIQYIHSLWIVNMPYVDLTARHARSRICELSRIVGICVCLLNILVPFSLCVSICPSVWLSFHMSVRTSLHLSFHLSVCPSVCLFLRLTIMSPVLLSFHLSVCLFSECTYTTIRDAVYVALDILYYMYIIFSTAVHIINTALENLTMIMRPFALVSNVPRPKLLWFAYSSKPPGKVFSFRRT